MTTATMARACQQIRRWVHTQDLGDLTDRQLLERFASKEDESAFSMLVRRHGGMVLGVCRAVLQHQQDAEDAFQATFLVLARRATGIHWQESVASWLFQTARHMAFKVRTHAARRRTNEVAMEDIAQVEGVANLAWGELRSILDEELGRLPEKYRAALVLCHMEGKSRTEAARELGWKVGAVKIRLERGRDLLRVRLTRRGLALSTGMLATMLDTGALSAAVPGRLMDSTVTAAACFAAGRDAAAGLVSAQAVALARGGLGAMAFSKSKLVALTVVALLATAGTGMSLHRPAVAQSVAALEADSAKTPADAKAATQDVYGDPLPQGARMRFGTTRLRHGGPVSFVGFAAKGKELVTTSQDGTVRIWEMPSGKELRRISMPQQAAGPVGQGGIAVANVNGAAMMARPFMAGATVVALSADGQLLALSSPDGKIQLYEVATGKPTQKIQVGGITGMNFAPDGKALATRSADGSAVLWDVTSGKEIRKFGAAANPNNVNGLNGVVIIGNGGLHMGGNAGVPVFAHDGKTIALHKATYDAKNQKTISEFRLWEVETGKEIRSLKDDQVKGFGAAGVIAFAPDGKSLAWSGTDGTIHLLDGEGSKELRTFGEKAGPVIALSYAPDSKSMAVQVGDKVVRIYELESGKELHQLGDKEADPRAVGGLVRFTGNGGTFQSLAYSPAGDVLAVAGNGNTVRLWNVATGKEILPVAAGHQGAVSTVVVSADGKSLISRGADNVVRVWDMATGKESRQFKLPAEAGTSVFSASGALLAFGMPDSIQVWDVAKGSEVQKIKQPAAPANQFGGVGYGSNVRMAFSPDGKFLAARASDAKVHLWDVTTGAETRVLDEPMAKQDVKQPGAAILMVRGFGLGSAGVIFSSDGALVGTVSSNAAMFGNANLAPVNRGGKSAVYFWSVLTGKLVRQFQVDRPVSAFALSPDNRNLATLNSDASISVWEMASGKERCQIKAGGVLLGFAADGNTLAVAGNDNKVTVFDVRNGKDLGRFEGHQGPIMSLAFAPDASSVVTGSADSTVLSWDLSTLSKEGRPQATALDATQVEARWNDLNGGDGRKAFEAVVALSLSAGQALPWLKDHIQPATGDDPKRIERLLEDLDNTNFQVRQKATEQLEKLGELAEPALEKALKSQPNLDLRKRIEALLEKLGSGAEPSTSILQALRGVEVLEILGSPEARQVLEKLAKGAAGAQLTRAAEASLQRMTRPVAK